MRIKVLSVLLFYPLLSISVAEESPTVRLSVVNEYNQDPLLLDSLRYQGARGDAYSVTRASYLLSGLAFESEDGEWLEVGGAIGLFDAARGLTSMDFSLPGNRYQTIRFNIGLPADLNHSDPSQYPARHPLNPDNNLHWTWATGYIFMALEGRLIDGEGEIGGYVYHLANDGNSVSISLPIQLAHSKHSLIELSLDFMDVFGNSEPHSLHGLGSSTHSLPGDQIARLLKRNLSQAFQVRRIQEFNPREKEPAPNPIDMPEAFTPHAFTMSRHFPMPELPADNPLIEERVALGKALFFDPILSDNGLLSCASCHQPGNAFSDPRVLSTGASGADTRRHSMPLFNLAWKDSFFWDGRVKTLREQVMHPIESPDELGSDVEDVIERLSAESKYVDLFEKAFRPSAITKERIGLALENYLLTLLSYDSRFDRAMSGAGALTDAEKRGFELFMTEYDPRTNRFGADCFHCHGGALFTDNDFHNNGLLSGIDLGRSEFSGETADQYKFATPSLRNVALTAPYMHDGSMATLEDVVAHYSHGIYASETLDPNLAKHPREGIQLTEEDQQALVAFLKTLSDPQYLEP